MAETFEKSLEIIGRACTKIVDFFVENPFLSDMSLIIALAVIAFFMGWFFAANRR